MRSDTGKGREEKEEGGGIFAHRITRDILNEHDFLCRGGILGLLASIVVLQLVPLLEQQVRTWISEQEAERGERRERERGRGGERRRGTRAAGGSGTRSIPVCLSFAHSGSRLREGREGGREGREGGRKGSRRGERGSRKKYVRQSMRSKA